MKRLFVAVPISREIKEKIISLIQKLRNTEADLKSVSLENLHFTLKFLGKVEEDKIPEIVAKVMEIPSKPFSISLQGMGVFPSLERIKVVWAGINGPELISLIKKINQSLNYIRRGEHEESPHLTLARVKSGKNEEKLQRLVEKYKNTLFGEMRVEKMILYESELGKAGPKYTKIKEFAFLG